MVNETTKQNKDVIGHLAQTIHFILESDYGSALFRMSLAMKEIEKLKETKDKEEW